MALSSLKLEVLLSAIDKATAPLKRIQQASVETTKELKATRNRLADLQKQQEAVESFRKLQAETDKYSNKLQENRRRLDELKSAKERDGQLTETQQRYYGVLTRVIEGGNKKLDEKNEKLRQVKEQMRNMGITDLANAESRLKDEVTSTTAAIDRQRQAINKLKDEQRRLMAAKERYDQTRSRGADLQGAGASMIGAGVVMAAPVVKSVQDFASFEDAMLGVARQVPGAKDDGAQLTSVYAAVREHVHALGREIPLTTNQIAEMITAGARMEVGKDAKTPEEMVRQLAEFTRNSAAMAIAFDAVPDEIAEQMGKVAKNFGIPVTSIGNLADAINYLDDNAISKGGDIINVLNRISGVISTVKMSANDAAALGSTLLTLGDRPEVAATAINAITQKLAAATKGSKKFQQAVKEIGWSSVDIQRGMQTDATATYMELFRRLEKVAPDKRVGIMVELVGLDHSDTLAKLANGTEEFKRQLELANAEAAKGSMGREMESRQQALSAQFAMARNRAYELTTTLGESLKPGLLALLNVVNPIVERMAAWARENQGTVAVLMGIAGTIAVVLAVVGTLTLAVGTLLAPIALANYALALMGGNSLTSAASINGAAAAMKAFAVSSLAWVRVNLLTIAGLRGLAASLASPIVGGLKGAATAMQAFAVSSLAWVRVNLLTIAGLRGLAASFSASLILGIKSVALAIKALSVSLLTNPVILVISAIALSAFLIYKYWQPISGFFSGFWSGFTSGLAPLGPMISSFGAMAPVALQPVINTLKKMWDWLSSVFNQVDDTGNAARNLGASFGKGVADSIVFIAKLGGMLFDSGVSMVQGLINGIRNQAKELKDAVYSTAEKTVGWFKEKLGIKSPSRVFAEAGAEIPAGAALGIEQSDAVRRAALAMAASALVAVPGMAGAQVLPGALPALPPAVQQVMPLPGALPALPPAVQQVMPLPGALPALPPAVQQVMPLPGALPQVVQPISLDAPQIVQPKLAPSMSTAEAMPGTGSGGAAPQRAPYEIHIHQQPGESPDALISRLSRMIDDKMAQANRAAAARRRSSFTGD